jgi:NADH-quinone oxidoreductase subunit J
MMARIDQVLARAGQVLARAGKARLAPAWVLTLAISLLLVAVGSWAPGNLAHAQVAPGDQGDHAGHDHPEQAGDAPAAPEGQAGAAAPEGHGAATPEGQAGAAAPGARIDATLTDSSPGAALFFWLFALMVVGGSVFVITRRNLISAVMGMVGTFFAIAAVFTMLYAHFLSAIQVLVYAGAIMVLFVFVIMIMNKPEDHPWGRVGTFGNIAAVALVLYLLVRMGTVLWNVPVEPRMVRPPSRVAITSGIECPPPEQPVPLELERHCPDFGTTKAIGDSLFHEYLFPFEAVSLVLLIAVIGALAVARPHEKSPAAPTASTPSPNA